MTGPPFDQLGNPTRAGVGRELQAERARPFGPGVPCAVPDCPERILFGRYFACDVHRALMPEAALATLWREYDERAARGKRPPTPAYQAAAAEALAAVARGAS